MSTILLGNRMIWTVLSESKIFNNKKIRVVFSVSIRYGPLLHEILHLNEEVLNYFEYDKDSTSKTWECSDAEICLPNYGSSPFSHQIVRDS